jgi:hypothetical protein
MRKETQMISSKPSLIWSNLGGEVIRISEAKCSPKKLGTQISGKFSDRSSADEKKITVELLF